MILAAFIAGGFLTLLGVAVGSWVTDRLRRGMTPLPPIAAVKAGLRTDPAAASQPPKDPPQAKY